MIENWILVEASKYPCDPNLADFPERNEEPYGRFGYGMKNSALAKTRREIAYHLGISYSTLYRRLKKSDLELSPGLLTPAEVKMVYQVLGFPVPEEYKNVLIYTHTHPMVSKTGRIR